jgi:hypothetical protein
MSWIKSTRDCGRDEGVDEAFENYGNSALVKEMHTPELKDLGIVY